MTTKKELYDDIDRFRREHDITGHDILTHPIRFAQSLGYLVEYSPFRTPGLRGMAAPLEGWAGAIILNSRRGETENGFVAAHEMTHCIRHIGKHHTALSCYDDPSQCQNAFYEWEANESAAELIMPYRIFIPDYVSAFQRCQGREDLVLHTLAKRYAATMTQISFRVHSLKFEIAMYCSTGQISSKYLQSRTALQRRGIDMDRVQMADLIALAGWRR